MKGKRLACALLLISLTLPIAAHADGIAPGQKPPRNEQSEVFVELHKEELIGWDGAYTDAFAGVEEVILWRYPGSGQVMGRSDTRWFRDNVNPAETFQQCYRDGEGRFWGYISYIYGQRMNWICISDPGNDAIPADPEMTAAVDKGVNAMLWEERTPAVLLVAGVVVVTGVLLYLFWYRRRRKGEK